MERTPARAGNPRALALLGVAVAATLPPLAIRVAAARYSVVVPLKECDCDSAAAVLFAVYAAYARTSTRGGAGETHGADDLVGPPRVMAAWPRARRRTWVLLLCVWAAGAILAS